MHLHGWMDIKVRAIMDSPKVEDQKDNYTPQKANNDPEYKYGADIHCDPSIIKETSPKRTLDIFYYLCNR
jgi:hypothetical protein